MKILLIHLSSMTQLSVAARTIIILLNHCPESISSHIEKCFERQLSPTSMPFHFVQPDIKTERNLIIIGPWILAWYSRLFMLIWQINELKLIICPERIRFPTSPFMSVSKCGWGDMLFGDTAFYDHHFESITSPLFQAFRFMLRAITCGGSH